MYTLVAGILPAIVLVFYIYLLDKNQREPLAWVIRAFCYGMAAVLPIIALEGFLVHGGPAAGTFSRAYYEAFLVAALCEEGMKFFFLWLFLRRNPYFDERMDCIVYAVCVSMGFAAVENISYLIGNLDKITEVAVMRGFMSVPGHFFFAVFMGYFMSLAIWGSPRLKFRNWLLTLLVPILLHGIYDACLMVMPISDDIVGVALIVFVLLGIFVWVGGHRRISRVMLHDRRNMPQAFVNPLKHEGIYNKDEKSHSATTYTPSSDDIPLSEPSPSAIPPSEPLVTPSSAESVHAESTPRARLFRHPFSFNGRIGRREYAISFAIYLVWYTIVKDDTSSLSTFASFAGIPVFWFYLAQGCKRCHDLNHSGYWQLIPFYVLWLLFQSGDPTDNEYGTCCE